MGPFTLEDKSFMRLALKKAAQGTLKGQTPFGACIVRRGKVVALSHNRVWRATDITAHAEIQAIRSACRKLNTVLLSDCVIYSTCEPCPMCFSACHWAGIKEIYFGAYIRDAKNAGFNELCISAQKMKSFGKSPVKIRAGLLREQNIAFLKNWSSGKNKKLY